MAQRKGYKQTEEHKKNLSLARKGYKHTLEARKKMSESKKNLPKEFYKKHGESLRGKKHSEETKMKMRLSHKGMLGKKMSEEARIKMINKLKGRKFSEEHKAKMKIARVKLISPKKDTTIEVKIQNYLKELNLDFFTHQYIKIEHAYQCDILIPSMNLVIECDGNYWHKYPIGKEIDHIRTKELIEKGFKVLRLWEFEINQMSLDKFKERLSG